MESSGVIRAQILKWCNTAESKKWAKNQQADRVIETQRKMPTVFQPQEGD